MPVTNKIATDIKFVCSRCVMNTNYVLCTAHYNIYSFLNGQYFPLSMVKYVKSNFPGMTLTMHFTIHMRSRKQNNQFTTLTTFQ